MAFARIDGGQAKPRKLSQAGQKNSVRKKWEKEPNGKLCQRREHLILPIFVEDHLNVRKFSPVFEPLTSLFEGLRLPRFPRSSAAGQ